MPDEPACFHVFVCAVAFLDATRAEMVMLARNTGPGSYEAPICRSPGSLIEDGFMAVVC